MSTKDAIAAILIVSTVSAAFRTGQVVFRKARSVRLTVVPLYSPLVREREAADHNLALVLGLVSVFLVLLFVCLIIATLPLCKKGKRRKRSVAEAAADEDRLSSEGGHVKPGRQGFKHPRTKEKSDY